jgi:glutathione S-transferase
MKLFFFPGSCALAVHILLEETGKPYDLQAVDLLKGEQYAPSYTAINPKSKVPALQRDDGSILTELPAISWYLARTNPQANLLPTDIEGEVRTMEALDYMVGTVHMGAFSRIFRPEAYSDRPEDKDKVVQAGREMAIKGLSLIAPHLENKEYCMGKYSLADAMLFCLELWAGRVGIQLPASLEQHHQRMLARPAVQRALKAEGLA